MKRASTPGIYHLVLRLTRPASLQVGRLGRFDFPAGYYVYTGSARMGLEARIARHRRGRKRMRWHIDYLLRAAELVEVVAVPATARIECVRNGEVLSLPGASVLVPRFGASDCGCAAHLAYFARTRPNVRAP